EIVSMTSCDLPGEDGQPFVNLGRRNRQAPVSLTAGERHPRFELRVPGSVRRQSARRIIPGEFDGRDPGTQKIRVKADDDIGAIEAVMRKNAGAMRLLMRIENRRGGEGIVHDVARIVELRQEVVDGCLLRGTGDGAAEIAQGGVTVEPRSDRLIHLRPRSRLSTGKRLLQPKAVVQP